MKQNIFLHIANLTLCYEIDEKYKKLLFLPSHAAFKETMKAGDFKPSAFSHVLSLQVKQKKLSRQGTWHTCLFRTKIWELWRDNKKRLVFYNPSHEIVRQITVTPDFTSGQLFGDFSAGVGDGIEVLPQGLEIVLFANWLAGLGDLILHASGIALDGKGYAFIGSSGAGKSTLAASLYNQPSLTVLGEDQVILRMLDGQFMIFGTPWHINPGMCSPVGVPLAGLIFLDRNGSQGLKGLTPSEGVAGILRTAFVPYYRLDALDKILARLEKLVSAIPCKTLSYQLGADLVPLIRSI